MASRASFRTQTTASKVAIGIAILLALGPLAYGFSMFDEGTSTPIWQGVLSWAVAIAMFAGGGALSKALGREVEVDDEGIRTRGARGMITVRWSDRPTGELWTGPWTRGSRVLKVRVSDAAKNAVVFQLVEMVGVGTGADRDAHAVLEAVRARVPLTPVVAEP